MISADQWTPISVTLCAPSPPNQCCTAIRATARWSFAAPPLLCDSTLIWGGGGLAQSRRTVTGMCSKLMPWAAPLTYLNSNVNFLTTKGKLHRTERRNKKFECCLCGISKIWTSISIVLATRMVYIGGFRCSLRRFRNAFRMREATALTPSLTAAQFLGLKNAETLINH